jgi:Type IV secretion system pilin
MPLLILTFLLAPSILFAADSGFVPLVGIPYVDTASGSVSLGDYVNSLYWASISIAAVLAVLRIIWAGIKYMLSEIVTEKGQAKKDIQGALYGLILIIGAVLLLDTINPTITKLTALDLKPLTSEVGGHDFRPPRIFTNEAGVLTLDPTTATKAEIDAFISDCIKDKGLPVTFMTKIECQAKPSTTTVVNTEVNFKALLTASPTWQAEIVGKTSAEIAAMEKEELELYRRWIANLEPDPGTYSTAAILAENGASALVFIVKNPDEPIIVGALSAYEARCEFYTGADNLVRLSTGNYACLRE